MVLLSSGLVLSLLYSLEALSFVLIIRGTGVLNFAMGEMLVLGPYIFSSLGGGSVAQRLPALVLTCVAAAVFGAGLYLLLLRRMQGRPIWATVIALFALSDIMQAAIQLGWGVNPSDLRPIPFRPLEPLPGFLISTQDAAVMAGSTVAIVALFALTYGTRLGLRMRACSEDPNLARYRGISVRNIGVVSWILGTIFTFVAGIALAIRTQLAPDLSGAFLTAFPAVLIGGFESLVGAVVGSFILAFILDAVALYGPSGAQIAVGYALLLAMLMFRPYGLFGSKSEVRV